MALLYDRSAGYIRPPLARVEVRHDQPLQSPGFREDRSGAQPRLRRVSQDGRHLGTSQTVPHLWPWRLLRRLEEQARDQAFSLEPAPDHHVDRARRELELVLHR